MLGMNNSLLQRSGIDNQRSPRLWKTQAGGSSISFPLGGAQSGWFSRLLPQKIFEKFRDKIVVNIQYC